MVLPIALVGVAIFLLAKGRSNPTPPPPPPPSPGKPQPGHSIVAEPGTAQPTSPSSTEVTLLDPKNTDFSKFLIN